MKLTKVWRHASVLQFIWWISALALLPIGAAAEPLCEPHPVQNKRLFPGLQLKPCANNVWFNHNNSDTVFVFVHGILSNSRSAWFHEDERNPQNNGYWPELVRTDSRFEDPSIFLGGYYTEMASGIYDIRSAANDLLDSLNTSGLDGKSSALSKKNIVFVAHSTGGIVVRHLLSRVWNTPHFRDKAIGLVLVASPSIGAKDADRVRSVSRLLLALGIQIQNKMAEQLRWHDSFLTELDKDFRTMKHHGILPYMTGTELIESRFLVPWLRQAQIVTPDSAARYFDEGHLIGGTDHSTIAKPTNLQNPSSHTKLLAFFEGSFRAQVAAAQRNRPPIKVILMDSYAKIYERNPRPGEMNSHVIRRALQPLPLQADDIEPVYFNWNDDERIAERHPDLIIIHYSSLETGGIRGENSRARLRRFLEHVLRGTNKTKIIVYSRVNERTQGSNLDAEVRGLVPAGLSSRVHGFAVQLHGAAYHTFNNEKVGYELRKRVAEVLNLKN